jgi:hypothetical protein
MLFKNRILSDGEAFTLYGRSRTAFLNKFRNIFSKVMFICLEYIQVETNSWSK